MITCAYNRNVLYIQMLMRVRTGCDVYFTVGGGGRAWLGINPGISYIQDE